MRTLLRSLLWQRVDLPGLEHFRLWQTPEGAQLEGTVVAALDGAPVEARYTVACSPAWETRSVRVEVSSGAGARSLELTVDAEGRWHVDGRRIDELDGCVDVDLAISPSTNTLPIRRLDLAVGETRDVTAAWIRFPELAVMRLPQRYTRVAERRYRYESGGGSFVREIEVDELGLVVRYPGLWERCAET
ncbi:MAG: putative glycolipid-binding domain-containing protein [Gemmatimonadota bacterium]